MSARLTWLTVALLSSVSFADIVSEEVGACQGLAAGGTCTLPDGSSGQCIAQMISRPDYSKGIPPGVKQVEVLTCVTTVAAPSARVFPRLAILAALALSIFSLSAWMRRRQFRVA